MKKLVDKTLKKLDSTTRKNLQEIHLNSTS